MGESVTLTKPTQTPEDWYFQFNRLPYGPVTTAKHMLPERFLDKLPLTEVERIVLPGASRVGGPITYITPHASFSFVIETYKYGAFQFCLSPDCNTIPKKNLNDWIQQQVTKIQTDVDRIPWFLKNTKPTAVEVKTSDGKWVAHKMRVLIENGEPILAVIHKLQITMRLQVSSLTEVKDSIPDKTPNYFHISTNGKLMKVRITGGQKLEKATDSELVGFLKRKILQRNRSVITKITNRMCDGATELQSKLR